VTKIIAQGEAGSLVSQGLTRAGDASIMLYFCPVYEFNFFFLSLISMEVFGRQQNRSSSPKKMFRFLAQKQTFLYRSHSKQQSQPFDKLFCMNASFQ
jgi:hypothetical protein